MDKEQRISAIMNKWEERKEQLTILFRNREKAAVIEPMNAAIADFLTFLFVMNASPVLNPKDILEARTIQLEFKPINLDERLLFILKKPHQYHSFIQLNELYVELLKLYAKIKIARHKK